MIHEFGTKVKNPCHRGGRPGYTECLHCKRLFTQLGISRHWDRCRSNPRNATTVGPLP